MPSMIFLSLFKNTQMDFFWNEVDELASSETKLSLQ